MIESTVRLYFTKRNIYFYLYLLARQAQVLRVHREHALARFVQVVNVPAPGTDGNVRLAVPVGCVELTCVVVEPLGWIH